MSMLRFTVRRLHNAIIYIIIGLTVVVDLTFWLVGLLQCHPISEFWQRTGLGHCISLRYVIDVLYLYSATACVCDFALVIVAACLVKDLLMGWRTKWAITGLLSMGCVYVDARNWS
jgi:hypothetical protein